jgi:chromosome segregation ATPase
MAACPFGNDCPNSAALLAAREQLELALQANDVLRASHSEAVERYRDITVRLTAEAAALAESHEESEASVAASRKALGDAMRTQHSLSQRLGDKEDECDTLQRGNAELSATVSALTQRIEELADALERMVVRNDITSARLRLYEERDHERVKAAATDRPSSGSTVHVRPMIDAIQQLEASRGTPSRSNVKTRKEPTTPTPSPRALSQGNQVSPHESDGEALASLLSRTNELESHSHKLALLCTDKPDLHRLQHQLQEVEKRNARLRTSLETARDALRVETNMAESRARAQDSFLESKALAALAQADEWRSRAEGIAQSKAKAPL